MKRATITVTIDGQTHKLPQGTPASELLPADNDCGSRGGETVVAARIDHHVRDVSFPLHRSCSLQWVRLADEEGMRVYRNSLVFLMLRAAKEVLPSCRVFVKHSLSNGLYGEIGYHRPVTAKDLAAVEQRMHILVAAAEPFIWQKISTSSAKELYRQQGMESKAQLLQTSEYEEVTVYHLGWYRDYLASTMVPHAGILRYFKLRYYLPGFILEYPKRDDPCRLPPYVEHGKLANVYFEAERWQETIQIHDAAALNRQAVSNGGDLIRVSEAYHEKRITRIADSIAENRDRLRIILIAGPSSSGKTSFAQRLSVQLRVNGLHPVAISLDDYFVDRDKTPRDEDGEYDFEALEAIDVDLFNEHLSQLIQGQEVTLPSYNFKKGEREWLGRTLSVSSEYPIIIEGIHGLNDALTAAIPKGRKFKIYVSALTNLNLDDHTRIPTTDVRLLRRLIRDHRFRSYSPLDTLARWPSVRRGEERHIFPFQEDADAMFNSALIYELAVIKRHAEPLLGSISRDKLQYSESRRLLRFLNHFRPLEAEFVIPCNSILREFIGGSCF